MAVQHCLHTFKNLLFGLNLFLQFLVYYLLKLNVNSIRIDDLDVKTH